MSTEDAKASGNRHREYRQDVRTALSQAVRHHNGQSSPAIVLRTANEFLAWLDAHSGTQDT